MTASSPSSFSKREQLFDKRVLEFLTVGLEYCRLLESVSGREKQELVETLTRLLPLLYIKASLLPSMESNDEIACEQFVTEEQYELLRISLAETLEPDDVYLDVFVEEMKYSETPVGCSLSEGLTDIYQDVKNFVEVYRLEIEEMMGEAVVRVTESFRFYWGQTLVNTLRPLHALCYASQVTDENEEVF